jgi:hypothetical protein
VARVAAGDRDVPHCETVLLAHEVDRAEHRTDLADRVGHSGKLSRLLRDAEPDGQAVGSRRPEVPLRPIHAVPFADPAS